LYSYSARQGQNYTEKPNTNTIAGIITALTSKATLLFVRKIPFGAFMLLVWQPPKLNKTVLGMA